MQRIDRGVASLASRVIVLTEGLAEEYRTSRRLADGVVSSIPNWTQVPDPPKKEAGIEYRRRNGIPESAFVIAFAGTFAESAGVDQLIRAVALRPFDRETVLLLAGDGACFEECRAMADKVSGARFVFHRPYCPEDASGILGASDLLVVPTRGQISLTALPSKLMHYMFAARPVLAVCNPNSELARIMTASCCGWAAEPDNTPALAQLLQLITHTPHESLHRMGEAARKYALLHFSPEACLPKLIRLIEETATFPVKSRDHTEDRIALD
jgi:glycosyltransferase involved in cell wall biosynthesis